MTDEVAPVFRPTARVLLIDRAERVLLFLMNSSDGQVFWCPPGGGVEPGETHEQAALRELTEETGWPHPILGPRFGVRRQVVGWGGVMFDVHEQWFLARVDELEVDTSGFTEDEKRDVDRHAWWTLAELSSSADRLVPANLAAVVSELLESGPPAHPWQLEV